MALKTCLLHRFYMRFAQGTKDECWEWQANDDNRGYGFIKVSGTNERVHRVSWQFFYGPIPKGKLVLHHCDNRACVNPNHLYLGDYADNTHDCLVRGRWGKPNSKFSSEEILAMRAFVGSTHELMKTFNISRSYAKKIRNGTRRSSLLEVEA